MLNLRVIQALKESQKINSEQSAKIKALLKEVQLLQDQLESSTTSLVSASSKAGKIRAAALALEGGDQIQLQGKKFAIVESLWLDPEIFDLLNDFEHHPDSVERFDSDTAHDKGTLAALYKLIPEKLHAHMVDIKEVRVTVRLFFLFANISSADYTVLSVSLQ